ncbi:hypothetical protein K0M31_017797 [Melipona bicolor]|uniref:Uncharacterized protein n=1 Tax=Melipona bicolor TaxID=60889 RepID=A0AA40KSU8_9HYME|nr:hypothetical protein K0M31_017797 [Melipona bicolor]
MTHTEALRSCRLVNAIRRRKWRDNLPIAADVVFLPAPGSTTGTRTGNSLRFSLNRPPKAGRNATGKKQMTSRALTSKRPSIQLANLNRIVQDETDNRYIRGVFTVICSPPAVESTAKVNNEPMGEHDDGNDPGSDRANPSRSGPAASTNRSPPRANVPRVLASRDELGG